MALEWKKLAFVLFGKKSDDSLEQVSTDDNGRLSVADSQVLAQLDITLSALRDALRGSGTKDLTTLETDIEAIMARLPSSLRNGRLDGADTYTAGEVLADQDPDDAAATFTFANPMDLIWVRCDGGDGRADPFGGTPTATAGIICEDGIPNPLTIRVTSLKVYAGSGVSVNVWGYRYG